jgi:uncharacterized protein
LDFELDRRSAFSFNCRVCGRCCRGKIIMAGPHEVLGMARLLGISTTEFLALYSDNGGTTLRSEADSRCIFLTQSGCKVHPRRPLVCRLYPLGRMIDGAGTELFAVYPPDPGCESAVGRDGTVETFLESQGVEPYFESSRRYGEVYRRIIGILDRLDVVGKVDRPAAREPASDEPFASDPSANRAPLSSWQDIDRSLAEYCSAKGLTVPEGIEESITLHLRAIAEWLDALGSRAAPAG